MRRFFVGGAACAILVQSVPAKAQEVDRSLGPWFGAHYTRASALDVNGEYYYDSVAFGTTPMNGGGITLGYGLTRGLSAFATMDLASGSARTDSGFDGVSAAGSTTLHEVDAGFRLQIPLHRFTPYALIAYSSRLLEAHECYSSVSFGLSCGSDSFTMWGGGVTYGAGLEFFFSRAWTADLSWQQTSGKFHHGQDYGDVYAADASLTGGSRLLVGVDWHAGSQSTPIDTKTPLENGQEVRVFVGTQVVSGRVAYVGRDSLTVQRMVNRAAVQEAVPVACIARIERVREARPVKEDLINSAVLGALGGALVGAVVNGENAGKPKKDGAFFLTYYLGGAVIGSAVGAWISALSVHWEPAPPLPVPETTAAERTALCAPWSPAK